MFLAAPISYQVKRIIQLIKAKPIAKVSDSFNIFQLIQSAKFQGSFEPFPDWNQKYGTITKISTLNWLLYSWSADHCSK